MGEKLKSFFESCKKRKKFVEVDKSSWIQHLEKAKHDLASSYLDFENRCWDWVVIKSYYAIHHTVNALLLKNFGFYSKDHLCALVASFVLGVIGKQFYSDLREKSEKFEDLKGIYSLRKISQYDVILWKDVSRDDAKAMISLAEKLVRLAEGDEGA